MCNILLKNLSIFCECLWTTECLYRIWSVCKWNRKPLIDVSPFHFKKNSSRKRVFSVQREGMWILYRPWNAAVNWGWDVLPSVLVTIFYFSYKTWRYFICLTWSVLDCMEAQMYACSDQFIKTFELCVLCAEVPALFCCPHLTLPWRCTT